MLLTSLTTVAVGFAAAAVIALIAEMWAWLRSTRAASGKSALVGPVMAAGVAMFGFHVWSTYSWFESTAEQLPRTMVVAETQSRASALAPWTLLAPPVDRFAAVDRASILRMVDAPSLAVADVTLVQRFGPTVSTRQIYDCVVPQRINASGTVGPLTAADTTKRPDGWIAVDPNDPIRRIVCEPIVEI